jgi:hypothetical protein
MDAFGVLLPTASGLRGALNVVDIAIAIFQLRSCKRGPGMCAELSSIVAQHDNQVVVTGSGHDDDREALDDEQSRESKDGRATEHVHV